MEYLNIESNRIIDISPLSGLIGLKGLFCQNNMITDIMPVVNMLLLEDIEFKNN